MRLKLSEATRSESILAWGKTDATQLYCSTHWLHVDVLIDHTNSLIMMFKGTECVLLNLNP